MFWKNWQPSFLCIPTILGVKPGSSLYPMAERIAAIAPFAFVIVLALIINWLVSKKFKKRKLLIIVFSLVLAIAIVVCYFFIMSILVPKSFVLTNC